MFGRTINFGNYGPDHGLVVVDMQSRYFKNSPRTMVKYLRWLKKKIALQVEECISLGGEVIFIEYNGPGRGTFQHLKNSVLRGKQKNGADNYGCASVVVKNANGVLSGHPNNTKYVNKNTDFFLQRKGKKYTVVGVNAYMCVSECATNLDSIGCKVRVHVGMTLNASCGAGEQRISRLDAPRRIIHSPAIFPALLPIFRGKTFLDYL